MDKCPTTPAGRKVDAQGCEVDSDNDGVLNAQDKCPTTPAGRKVNADGCELDGDNDGVVDALDQCPTTAPGRKVDHRGCDIDSDNDGVPNVFDNCPNTPAGQRVNDKGCVPDGDNDGVPDAIDLCPTTPTGDKVDAKGCTLLETINLKGVVFDMNSDKLRPESFAILDQAAETLKRYNYPKTEVGGHTDDIGNDDYNMKLSERRAKAVMQYLIGKGCPESSLSARGYGETQPIADNAPPPQGQLANRRVELRFDR
jgi:OOP family OmpA-OmpF porin